MKIAMIGHKRIPSREGGVEIVVENLAVRMAALGQQVTAYNRKGKHIAGTAFDDGRPENRCSFYRGVRLCPVPTIDRKGLAAVTSSFTATIKAILDKNECIHYHAEGPCAVLWVARLFGIRTVATIHGLDWQRGKWKGFARWYLKLGEKTAVRFADEIIVLSRSTQDYFMKQYHRKTVLIPNGINKPEIKPARLITEQWGLQPDDYILFVGRIVPEKGLDYLLKAWKSIDTQKRLVIAGSGSDTSDYFNSIQNQTATDDRIVMTGFVQGERLEELYSNAYLYCLPSDLEGMPISLLEAMSYGCCCLTSDIPECTEVLQDFGRVFKRSDAADLGRNLQELCDHPETTAILSRGVSDSVCARYNWDDITKRTLALYHEGRKALNKHLFSRRKRISTEKAGLPS